MVSEGSVPICLVLCAQTGLNGGRNILWGNVHCMADKEADVTTGSNYG